jgi:uncharacterized protein DUF4440
MKSRVAIKPQVCFPYQVTETQSSSPSDHETWRFQETGPFDKKPSTEYKLDIRTPRGDLQSCIGQRSLGKLQSTSAKSPRTRIDCHRKEKGAPMKAKNPVSWISVCIIALLAGPSVTPAQTGAEADAATVISDLENDAVKADLSGDPAFYQKVLAEDWTRGDSDGTYYTKAQLLNLMADTKNIKTNSEKLTELKVRVYGNTAVATYKDTYDILIMGQHRAHTIIATDTFVKMGDEWKQVASHGAEVK